MSLHLNVFLMFFLWSLFLSIGLFYSVFVYFLSNEREKNGRADERDLEGVGRREIVTGIYHIEKYIFDKF